MIELLQHYASPAASGALAYGLMELARRTWPAPVQAPTGWRRLAYVALYTPRYARLTALALASLIALLFGLLAAYATGQQLDLAAAAGISYAVSQILHAIMQLSSQAPASFLHPASVLRFNGGSTIHDTPADLADRMRAHTSDHLIVQEIAAELHAHARQPLDRTIGFTLPGSGERATIRAPRFKTYPITGASLQRTDSDGRKIGAPIELHSTPHDPGPFYEGYTINGDSDEAARSNDQFLRAEGFPLSQIPLLTASGPIELRDGQPAKLTRENLIESLDQAWEHYSPPPKIQQQIVAEALARGLDADRLAALIATPIEPIERPDDLS